MVQNVLTIIGAALVPLLVGSIWFNPKVFGTGGQAHADRDTGKLKKGHPAKVYVACVILSLLLAIITISFTIHQTHVFSLFEGDTSAEGQAAMHSFLAAYGDRFRTFGHGALHGIIAGIFIVLPIVGVNALFEGKGFKYIFVNVGYWTVCLVVMGGITCQFLKL